MKNFRTKSIGISLAALSCIFTFAAASASAVLVTWELNPKGLEKPVGSSNVTVTEYGRSITAYGWTVNASGDTPLGLYYKNQGFDETGLGILGPSDHELQSSGGLPLQYIQLDLGAILATGQVFDGKLQIGSVQGSSNDTFSIYGSSTLGTLGTKISATFDSSSDLLFVSIPNFGAYQYISVGSLSGDVLPVAFQAFCIPEMNALFPIVGLIAAVSFTQLLRRRHLARSISL